ncbi:hypothetical protein OGAPHI_003875 [Ogataea philodendri]|uniref:HECT-type E3 ubiquitin transferase n=1 Tax=Ogataea philodendri TaxID=1378263 RepID=A0A9P8P5N5_9ASCO|nr:uncharacterized protein OGAPHI_003875 [Ogataea philodendri]KAH3665687.1 hypothetical protein OGAPHI_003875 [Ogataea philodendri]
MNSNFTGTTRKRQVNLGNRSLAARNKNSFLQTAQLDRQRRERARAETRAVILLQSLIRRYLDLKNVKNQLGQQWDGRNLAEFNFFWPQVASDLYIGYLDKIRVIADSNQLTPTAASKTASVLIKAVTTAESPNFIKRSLQLILRIHHTYTISVDWDPLAHTLLKIYSQDPLFIETIFEIAPYTSKELILFLVSPQKEFIETGINTDYLRLCLSVETQFAWILNHESEFDGLSDLQRYNYLLNIVKILSQSSLSVSTLSIRAFSVIIGGISSTLNFDEDSPSSESIQVLAEDEPIIDQLYAPEFTKAVIKQCGTLENETDTFVSFFFALLHLVSGKASKNQIFKNDLLVNLIVASSSIDFMNSCFQKLTNNHFFAQVFVLAEEKNQLVNDRDFKNSLLDPSRELWWKTLFLLEELYAYLLSVSNDADLFNDGRLDQETYLYFVRFLRSLSLLYVLGQRLIQFKNLPATESRIFKFYNTIGLMTLRLLKQIYLRDLRMNLTDEGFWLLGDPIFSLKNVSNLVPLLELPDDDEDRATDSLLPEYLERQTNAQSVDNYLILTYLPFMVPFDTRAELFRQLVEQDRAQVSHVFGPKLQAVVSRENVLFDAFEQFGELRGQQFKYPLSVEFINQFGEKEAGIDGGGLTKELLTSIVDSAFIVSSSNENKNGGIKFFNATSSYQLYPNPDYFLKLKLQQQNPSFDFGDEEKTFYLQMLRFLGMVIGKCLYESVLTDVQFAPFFLSRWTNTTLQQQHRVSFDDLKTFDKELHGNLSKLLKLSEDELDSLDLSFTITEKLQDSSDVVTIDLLPGGRRIRVNSQNKLHYVYCMAKFKMDQSIAIQSRYFIEGLSQIIKPKWLSFFNQYEVAKLISGGEREISIEDLKKNTALGGFSMNDQTVIDLFELLEEFDNSMRSKFLKFVTSSSREPLLGFKELTPNFGIRNSGSDLSRLPTASTCVNLLKLPDYRNKKLLKEKLLYSINSHAGFDLS